MEQITSKQETGREVPSILWDLEEEINVGPLINDIFIGCSAPLSPKRPRSVVFVGLEQDNINGGFYTSSTINHNHSTAIPFDNHYSFNFLSDPFVDNKWLDDYVDTTNFGHLTIPSTNDGFATLSEPTTSFALNPEYNSDVFYNDQVDAFYEPETDHSASSSGISTVQFSHLNIQESHNGLDNTRPPVPESEYSASYSAPGSAYSTDWSIGSERSSALSQDEILEEIHRECAEIERKSVSPLARRNPITKKRHNRSVDYVSPLPSTSSTGSLQGSGGNSERKKELNRIAATRYREKKRRERDTLHVEQKELEVRNRELRGTMKELRSEIVYLRKLMKDMEQRSKQ